MLLTLGAPVQAQDGAPTSVTFTRRNATTVGLQRTETNNMDMAIDVNVSLNGQVVQSMKMVQNEVEENTQTILAANDEAPTKIKVAYGKMEATQSQGGPPMTETAPIADKTYLAERKGEEIAVTLEDGSEAPAAEAAAVAGKNENLGKYDDFSEFIPEGPMAVGSTIDIPKEKIQELFGDDGLEVESHEFKLTGMQEGVAVFSVKLKVGGEPEPGLKMGMDMTGELRVRPQDTWPTLLTLTGPVTMVGGQQPSPDQKIDILGKGTMNLKFTASYAEGGE
jgi:hypothetical protein